MRRRKNGEEVTYPLRYVYPAFLSDELQHASMCLLLFRAVEELKQHGICDMKPCEFVQSTWWQEDFAAVVGVFSIWPCHHGHRVTPKVLVKTTQCSSSLPHHCSLVHAHGVIVVEVAG